MFKKYLILVASIAASFTAHAGARYDLQEPITSTVVENNYVCQNVEDLNTIYSVTTLFQGDGIIGRQVAQKFVDKGLCQLIKSNGLRAIITSLQVGDDPSGTSPAYVFALSTFVTPDGKTKAAWAHMATFPGLMAQDGNIADLIAKKRVSGAGAFLLDNRSLRAVSK
jgi:hypothetical protein